MNSKETSIVKVAIDVPIDDFFDYECEENVSLGQAVLVPFGSRKVIGVVVEVDSSTELEAHQIKKIMRVNHDILFNEELFKLFKFVSSYYHYPIGQTIHIAIPSNLKKTEKVLNKKSYIYEATDLLNESVIEQIHARKKNLIQIAKIIFKEKQTDEALKSISINWKKYVKDLIDLNFVIEREFHKTEIIKQTKALKLNQEQSEIYEKILGAQGFEAFLIYGITGSGKTEVYMHLIEQYVKNNGQVLILVPEINLTPQLEDRFTSRFSSYSVISLHSQLTQKKRLENWEQAKNGEAQIIIGTRLSVFTPFKNLRAIIMDEEQDLSFKQHDKLRYHARDVAMMRAKLLNIPFIAGSATPSIEIWHRSVNENKLLLYKLSTRAVKDATLPKINIIKDETNIENEGISEYLKSAIKHHLDLRQQILIFINRRGYAPVLFCSSCGWYASCSRCSSKLVVHRSKQHLRCHHCDYQREIDTSCKVCGNVDLMSLGSGTQKVEERINKLFPNAQVRRVDRDTIKTKAALDKLYEDMNHKKIDILVGTQMLSKGHDFPNLSLVIVLDSDNALYSSDFRASERLFSQLVQVAGRAGRGSIPGEVVIQTNFPEHPLYQSVKNQDYESFASEEINLRKELNFPPFCFQAVLRAESKYKKNVEAFINQVYSIASQSGIKEVDVFHPVQPILDRLKGFERYQIYFHSTSRQILNQFLRIVKEKILKEKDLNKVKWNIDVDPVDF
jgi:primosomal protein N' (replication factor Y)